MQKRANQSFSNYDTYFAPMPSEESAPVYFSGHYTKLPYADDFPFMHYHNRYEIGICEEGEGLFVSENVYSSVSKGDLIFIAPSQRHYSRSFSQENYCVCRFAYINAKMVEQLISASTGENKKECLPRYEQGIPPVIHPEEHPKSAELLARIFESCAQKTQEGNTVATLLLSAFIIESRQVFQPFSSPVTASKSNDEISQILEYLSLHYADSDSSKTLAQKCHMSESQLRRRFVASNGMPPIAYRNLLRCRIAAELLTRTYMTVAQISNRIGFRTTSDFYRAFKKTYDISPARYRASRR